MAHDEGRLPFQRKQQHPIFEPQWPMVFDLIHDPIEQWDLIDQRLDCAWVFRPVAMKLGALSQSAAQYPHIKPGEEFAGYDRQPLASGDEFGV